MTRDELLKKICPWGTCDCGDDYESCNCDDCNRVLEEWLYDYEKHVIEQYKEKMEMQYLDDIDNPLEPLKLHSALQSEIFKFNYRKEHKPQDINILDYTVIYALKHCLEEQLKAGGKNE